MLPTTTIVATNTPKKRKRDSETEWWTNQPNELVKSKKHTHSLASIICYMNWLAESSHTLHLWKLYWGWIEKVCAKYYKEVEKEEGALNYCSMIKSKSSEEMQTHAHKQHFNLEWRIAVKTETNLQHWSSCFNVFGLG